MNNIEMEIDHRYTLTPVQICEGLRDEQWNRVFARWSFAMPDGRFASIILGEARTGAPRPAALALFGGGFTKVLPIELPAGPREFWDFSAFQCSDQIMLLRGTRSLTAVSTVEPYSSTKWSVTNDITQGPDSRGPAVRPSSQSEITTTANTAAIPLGGSRDGHRLGFLLLDVAAKQARWSSWPNETLSRLRTALSLILTSKVQDDVPYRSLVHLPSIEHWDDPQYGLNQPVEDYAYAAINQATVSRAGVMAFTNGHDTVQYGSFCSSLSVIDRKGRVAKRLFHEQYDRNDPKKRGISAKFTASGRYAILTRIFKSTDDWAGQQKLLDLSSGELINVLRPRGLRHYRLVDHATDTFWFRATNVIQGCDLVSCRRR